MDFLQKPFYGVFELPLPKNAQERTKTKSQEKRSRMVGGCTARKVEKDTPCFLGQKKPPVFSRNSH
jgi:hypothetical protein